LVSFVDQPLVSVVTPLYNCERYLSECIESVLAQTYENWDYTIVNNCSTDQSVEIAQDYARKDSRVHIVNNDRFLPVRANHNHALRQISENSRYCKVVQADDRLFPESIGRMVDVAEKNPTVGIVGSYRLDDLHVNCDGLPFPSTVVPGREICRMHLLIGLFVFGSPTTLLIRSDLIRNRTPFYNELSLHADTEACYELLQNSDFGFVHQVLSYTRRENESISSVTRSFNPNLLDKYIMVKKYGSVYLAPNEFRRCSKQIEGRYYGFLAESALTAKGKEFWEYQKRGLETVGERIKRIRLSEYVLLELIDLLFNPKMTMGRIIRHFSRN
jgi:glycosyltransferase involved in cell wall biosynthesis